MRRSVLASVAVVGVLAGSGSALAATPPNLTAEGPTEVSGTEASAVFTVGDRTVRQVRYADGGTLVYTFRLHNDGRLPLTVTGLAEDQPPTRLFRFRSLGGPDGGDVTIEAGGSARVSLALVMEGCESLSARAGSFVTEVAVRAERMGMIADDVTVTLPEEVHTGSPREAFCPNSTATSRPPG